MKCYDVKHFESAYIIWTDYTMIFFFFTFDLQYLDLIVLLSTVLWLTIITQDFETMASCLNIMRPHISFFIAFFSDMYVMT